MGFILQNWQWLICWYFPNTLITGCFLDLGIGISNIRDIAKCNQSLRKMKLFFKKCSFPVLYINFGPPLVLQYPLVLFFKCSKFNIICSNFLLFILLKHTVRHIQQRTQTSAYSRLEKVLPFFSHLQLLPKVKLMLHWDICLLYFENLNPIKFETVIFTSSLRPTSRLCNLIKALFCYQHKK